jgi:hypothetical protein
VNPVFSTHQQRGLKWYERLRDYIKPPSYDEEENPVKVREHKELLHAITADYLRHLRIENPNEDTSALFDRAVDQVDRMHIDIMTLRRLRYELQYSFTPQVLTILNKFKEIDKKLPSPDNVNDREDSDTYRSVLLKDYESTMEALRNPPSVRHPSIPPPAAFLRRKLGALRTLFNFYGWPTGESPAHEKADETVLDISRDDFGYNELEDDTQTIAEIRHYQKINMYRSALLKEELGYSVISLKSLVPGAGRGLFLDGQVMAGTVVGFYPGEVWPKEYLVDMPQALQKYFESNENCHLRIRGDENVIDSRRSPYTVLTNENSNAWAIGHIANHPPPDVLPNSRTVCIDYVEPMKLKKQGLMRYIPNTYARQPMLFAQSFFDPEIVHVRGLLLLAVRDCANEEIFYDYGNFNRAWLHPVKYPD